MNLSPALLKLFPLTFSLLGKDEAQELASEFMQEWGLDQIHFFPMLVRDKKMQNLIIEVADYEYLKAWVKDQAGGKPVTQAPYSLNTSAQFVWIEEAAAVLKKKPGLYVLWNWQGEGFEQLMSIGEAAVLDRLQEDQILLPSELTPEQAKILEDLISLKIVFATINQTELNS